MVRILLPFVAFLFMVTNPIPAAVPPPVDLGRGAWARLQHLEDARWLMVVTRFSSNEPSRLELLLSEDDCRQWKSLTELREPGRKFDNGHLLRLEHGTLLLTGRSLVDGQSYHLPVYASTNKGRLWRKISNIDSIDGATAAQKRGLWEPFLLQLPDGRVSVIYSSEKHAGYSQVLAQKTSADGGHTWGEEKVIVEEPGGGKLRPGMGVVTRLRDGRFFLVYEVVGMRRGLVHYKISTDGEHWPAGLGTPIEGHEAAPYVITLRDGRLLLTSCQNTLALSDDDGRSWRPLPHDAWPVTFRYTWPALYEVTPGMVVAARSEGSVRLRWFSLSGR
ncbi:MAG: glycoside hydrolase [Verrucomicrobiae bacterium]|nr:glycoside hydrolase [Verrucomicrobiae bacterium]